MLHRKSFFSWKFLAAGLLLGCHFVVWTSSLDFTSIASASVAVCTAPLFVVLLSILFLKRKFTADTIIGLFLAFGGAIILFSNDLFTKPNGILGVGLGLLAALFFAIYILIGEEVRKKEPLFIYVFPVYFIAMFLAVLLTYLNHPTSFTFQTFNQREILILLLLAIFPTILGHTSVNYLVKTISPTTLTLSGLSEPFFASLLAIPIFGEIPTFLVVLGGILTLGGIYVGIRKTKFS